MKLEFTAEEIRYYMDGKMDHHYYKECVAEAKKLEVHADGSYPECLIDERRPNEPEEVKAYRKKIWVPKTKPAFTRVYNSIQKIRRSSDWSIRYPNVKLARINEKETLEEYCEKQYPYFTSITNWVFQAMLRKYLIDPNGVALVFPLELQVAKNEYIKPFPLLFGSCDVVDFVPEDYAVLKDPVGCKYKVGNNWYDGFSYWFATTKKIYRYDQVNAKGKADLVIDYDHGLISLPVIPWKGSMIGNYGHYLRYESRLAGMIPELDEAAREYSDLQAGKVLHIYPERWEYTQNECISCKGKGQTTNPLWEPGSSFPCDTTCTSCQGRGYVAAGPYSKIMVRPIQGLEAGGQQIPLPPAGFVEKDVEIIKLMDAGVEQHIYNALAAVNMEFLANSPLATSGVSKAEDKYEAGNTVHSIAEDIVSFMDSLYDITAQYRYMVQYPNEIEEMLPVIAVPEKFDLVTSNDIGLQMKLAKEANANPTTINAMQVEYAHKKFQQEPEIRDRVALTIKLDPLAGLTEDEKMGRLSNKGITQLTYIISSNIQAFVQTAVDKDKDFASKTLEQQQAVITAMAQQIIDDQEAKILSLTNGVQPNTETDNESDQGISEDNTGGTAGSNAGTANAA